MAMEGRLDRGFQNTYKGKLLEKGMGAPFAGRGADMYIYPGREFRLINFRGAGGLRKLLKATAFKPESKWTNLFDWVKS